MNKMDGAPYSAQHREWLSLHSKRIQWEHSKLQSGWWMWYILEDVRQIPRSYHWPLSLFGLISTPSQWIYDIIMKQTDKVGITFDDILSQNETPFIAKFNFNSTLFLKLAKKTFLFSSHKKFRMPKKGINGWKQWQLGHRLAISGRTTSWIHCDRIGRNSVLGRCFWFGWPSHWVKSI